jgi:hypothetical protein
VRRRVAVATSLAILASAACARVLGLEDLTGPEANDGGASQDGSPSSDGASDAQAADDSSFVEDAEGSAASTSNEAGDDADNAVNQDGGDSSTGAGNDGSMPEGGTDAGDDAGAASTFGSPCGTGRPPCPSDYSFCETESSTCTRVCDVDQCPPDQQPCTAQCPDPPTNGYCGGTGGTSYCL